MAAHQMNQPPPRPQRPTINFGSPGPQRQRPGLGLGLNLPIPRRPENYAGETDFRDVMGNTGNITIDGVVYKTDTQDLQPLGPLGNGTCGHVVKMLHKPSNRNIAVKQMRRSQDENKRIMMDLQTVLNCDCEYIVKYLGSFITDSEVWICMELMETCLDKLLRNIKKPIPEHVIGKVAVSTVKALDYLKDKHNIIHRDVKPSNILLDSHGNVKLCDFGISGRLVDSKAQTRNAGCTAYMAPERIEPPDPMKPNYDIRADVWSLGITLVELAIGKFPYENCSTDFEVLSRIVNDAPPSLPEDQNFSSEFRSFINFCLKKNYRERPKYKQLLDHEFIKFHEQKPKAMETKVWLDVWCAPARKAAPSSLSRATGSGRLMRPSPSVGSTGSSISSANSPSPSSARDGRYEVFKLPERNRSNLDRLLSEPNTFARTPSTPGSPSPNASLPPEPPPRRSRIGSGSDGFRTPSLTTSSSSSSGGNGSSPMGISSISNGGTPSPTEPPPPPLRRYFCSRLFFTPEPTRKRFFEFPYSHQQYPH